MRYSTIQLLEWGGKGLRFVPNVKLPELSGKCAKEGGGR